MANERADYLINDRSPRYLHGFQRDVNDSSELPHTVPENNQVTYIDSFTNYGVDTVFGKEFVISASDGNDPRIQEALNLATTVQAAVDELDSEKENSLGNPSVDGYVLSSTTAGARSWVANGAPTYAQIIAILGFEPLSSCGYGLCYGLKYGGRG